MKMCILNKEKEQEFLLSLSPLAFSPEPLALSLVPLALQRLHQLDLVIEGDFGDGVEVAHPEFDGGERFIFGFAGELRFA